MLAFFLLVAATVNAEKKKLTFGRFWPSWKFKDPSQVVDGVISDGLQEADMYSFNTTVLWDKYDQRTVGGRKEASTTVQRAEGRDAWDKFADEVMKKSVYEDLQDWQLMAIVKAAPAQVEMMEAKLKKTKQKCARRRNVFPAFGGFVPAPGVSPGINNPSSQYTFFGAEGKDDKEKAKSEGKKGKKEKKMKPAKLVKKIESYDKKLKNLEKQIKKASKKCK